MCTRWMFCYFFFICYFFYRKLPYFRIWPHQYNVRIYMFLTRSTFLVIKSPKNRSGLHKLKLEHYFSKKSYYGEYKNSKDIKKVFWIMNSEFGIIIRDVGERSLRCTPCLHWPVNHKDFLYYKDILFKENKYIFSVAIRNIK